LQKCYYRIIDLIPPERILVLKNVSFVPLAREQLPLLPEENVIGEPLKRDTAAVIQDRMPGWEGALVEAFRRVQPISIDYGVMEKAVHVCCVAATFSWTDLGEQVMLVGVDDLVIVRVNGKTLVARKDRVEEIRKIVQNLDK
jgi:mannose-1-phosphate guanylyltransferase